MSPQFRPLLPNPPHAVRNDPEAHNQSSGRRVTAIAACESCRKRKSRCSGERPQCAVCVERQLPCEYTTLPTETHLKAQKRRLSDLELRCKAYDELFDFLRSQPEDVSGEVLRRMRSGADVEAVVKAIRDSALLMQLSFQPEYRFRYEFPYLDDMPLSLEQQQNPYFHPTLYAKLRALSPHQVISNEYLRSIEDEQERTYLMPYHAAELVEPRTSALDIAQWTAVSADNTLLRELLEVYFIFEYPYHAYFHKDFFLEDMTNGRTRFCSRLLVNAVLAAAWHGYRQVNNRAEYWRPDSLGYRFLAEARRLLDLEQASPSITAVQAAAIVNLTCNTNGTDDIGWPYLHMSLEMAKKLGLFSTSSESGTEWQVVAAVTAWSLFNWQAFATWHNFQPPLLPDPPKRPLPEIDRGSDPYGETWLKYPHARHPVPGIHGETFQAISRFRVIMNDAGKLAWTSPRGTNRVTLNTALSLRSRLLGWYNHLPERLTVKNTIFPCHLKLHMQYHVLLISLFEPLVGSDIPGGEESVEDIIAHSKSSLEASVRIYYLRHGFESYDPTLFQFLSLLAYSALKDMRLAERGTQQHEQMKSTLVLCAKGLRDQGRCCYVSEVISRLLLESAGAEDARFIGKFTDIEETNDRLSQIVQEIRSGWPIGVFCFPEDGEYLTLGRFFQWWEENRMT